MVQLAYLGFRQFPVELEDKVACPADGGLNFLGVTFRLGTIYKFEHDVSSEGLRVIFMVGGCFGLADVVNESI
jgi:hypothetical protein